MCGLDPTNKLAFQPTRRHLLAVSISTSIHMPFLMDNALKGGSRQKAATVNSVHSRGQSANFAAALTNHRRQPALKNHCRRWFRYRPADSILPLPPSEGRYGCIKWALCRAHAAAGVINGVYGRTDATSNSSHAAS